MTSEIMGQSSKLIKADHKASQREDVEASNLWHIWSCGTYVYTVGCSLCLLQVSPLCKHEAPWPSPSRGSSLDLHSWLESW